jgi:hypothetical protein
VITKEVADKPLYPAKAKSFSVRDMELSVGLLGLVSGELSVSGVGVPAASHLLVWWRNGPVDL